jgi:hypothetical protein
VSAGLVKCHLALNKVRDAAVCAKEAVSLYPRSSDAYLALGSVYAQTPSATGEVSGTPVCGQLGLGTGGAPASLLM